jgi:probable aminopeptidase NPEPL1
MIRIRVTNDLRTLLQCETLCVVAPRARFAKPDFKKAFPKPVASWIESLAHDHPPGDLGSLATSLTRERPARIAIGVLPDEVSRHDSPARAEMIRRIVGQAALSGGGTHGLVLALDDPGHALAAANAVYRALPLFSRKSRKEREGEVRLTLLDPRGDAIELGAAERSVCESTREMAQLVDMPPSELHPAEFAKRARSFVHEAARVTWREIAGDRLLSAKLRGIHAVGRTALVPPRMIVASHTPRKKAKGHVALVGKGVTYDTGGLSLKTAAHMAGMKADMGGAAAVLGAFRALCAAKCELRVSLVLCLAENAIGPASYKVDDILTLHSGKTVEINNTDAEGRLLLADGASYAARVLGADTILEAATLTGAQLVATGLLHAGIVSNDQALEDLLVRCGRESGDLCHPLPYAPAFFKQEFKSSVADMKNSVKDRNNAPSSAAAQFVLNHVEDLKGLRFGHVDLAGPAFPHDRATGFGVALLYSTVRALEGP